MRVPVWDLVMKPASHKLSQYLGEKYTETLRFGCCSDYDGVENRYFEHFIENLGDANVTDYIEDQNLGDANVSTASEINGSLQTMSGSSNLNDQSLRQSSDELTDDHDRYEYETIIDESNFFTPKIHATFHSFTTEGLQGSAGFLPNPGSFRQKTVKFTGSNSNIGEATSTSSLSSDVHRLHSEFKSGSEIFQSDNIVPQTYVAKTIRRLNSLAVFNPQFPQ